MTLDIDQDDYIGDLAEAAGVRVVVHPQRSMPFPEDEGISVSPGELTYIGLTQVIIQIMCPIFPRPPGYFSI